MKTIGSRVSFSFLLKEMPIFMAHLTTGGIRTVTTEQIHQGKTEYPFLLSPILMAGKDTGGHVIMANAGQMPSIDSSGQTPQGFFPPVVTT